MATTEDDLVELEDRAVRLLAGGYLSTIDQIRALLDTEPARARALILALVGPSIGVHSEMLLAEAYGLGLTDIAETLTSAETTDAEVALRSRHGADRSRDIDRLASTSRDAIYRAQTLARFGAPLAVAFSPILGDRAHVDMTIRSTVNATRSDAVTAAATAAGLPMTIEPERDACVRCLAYAGLISTDGSFPGGLTFGTVYPSMETASVTVPIHPRCRCRLVGLRSDEYAAALQREAKRSILRGYALPTESVGVRLRAAGELASRENGMPKSVNAFARRAVKAGRFPDQGRPERTSLAGR